MQAKEVKETIHNEMITIESYSVPLSARRIYKILSTEGPLTSGDIEKRCKYSDRTIRNALKRLIGIGVVKKIANFSDMRTSLSHLVS